MTNNNNKLRERIKADDWRVGHHPSDCVVIEDFTVRRCRCGFLLIMTPAGNIWWPPLYGGLQRIDSLGALLRALASRCPYYRHPDARRSALNAELEAARKRIKELTAPGSTASEPVASKGAAPSPVPKPPKTYIPNYTPTTPRGARKDQLTSRRNSM